MTVPDNRPVGCGGTVIAEAKDVDANDNVKTNAQATANASDANDNDKINAQADTNLKAEGNGNDNGNMKKETIICRCEDVSRSDLEELIKEGYTTLEEIKRICRLGMGPCRGSTCLEMAAREIARLTGKPLEEVIMPTNRPPLSGIKLSILAGDNDGQKDC